MTPSSNCLDLIREFEGCRLTAYQDQAGVWTIGYGHTGPEVVEGLVWTQDQADAALAQDAQKAAAAVLRLVDVAISQNQLDALVDFVFNEGAGHLASSTLLKLLNGGDPDAAAQQFPKWDIAAGETNLGLLRRRQAEQELFTTSS